MAALTHRQPEVRSPRMHDGEASELRRVYWNGRRTSRGDGAAQSAAGVDYSASARLGESKYFGAGQFGFGAGRFGAGPFGLGDAAPTQHGGFGEGRFGEGMFGAPAGAWSWTFPFALRNGVYRIGVTRVDAAGNEQAIGGEAEFEVAAVPRAVTQLRLERYDAGTGLLTMSWRPSRDLEDI